MYRFGVLGKDMRMKYLYSALLRDGYEAVLQDGHTEAEIILQSNVVVLPIGMSFNSVAGLCEGKTVFCAGCGGANAISYTDSEYFKIRNALPTAEGAIAIAMQNTDFTIAGSKCAVVGYGNIGKCLTDRLIGLGAFVSVFARRESSRAEAENRGAIAYTLDKLCETGANIIFNTVPAPVLGESVLYCLKRSTLIIDLASEPGGTDFELADRLGIQCIHALSLPGKAAPRSAGEILKDTVISILRGVK